VTKPIASTKLVTIPFTPLVKRKIQEGGVGLLMVNVQALKRLHKQMQQHLNEYEYHIDFEARLKLIKKSKHLLAEYFKHSVALNRALYEGDSEDEHLQTTLRIYARGMHEEGKKIISTFLKYGHGCENKYRFKFQMEIAEAINLLEHRIKNEKEHLLPEYLKAILHEPEYHI